MQGETDHQFLEWLSTVDYGTYPVEGLVDPQDPAVENENGNNIQPLPSPLPDEGICEDGPDDRESYAFRMQKMLDYELMSPDFMFCGTLAMVAIFTRSEEQLYLCYTCYIAYMDVGPPDTVRSHGHVNTHHTGPASSLPQMKCSSCKMTLLQLVVTKCCLVCNGTKKMVGGD